MYRVAARVGCMTRSGSVYPALLAVTMAAAALFYPQFSLNHDSSWYLVATRMLLAGERLYVGVVEINPPLVFYLTAPALYLADLTGLSDTRAYLYYAIALGGLSSLWLSQIVRRSSLESAAQDVLLLAGLVGIFLLPVGEFGQREHFLLIFALPYLYRLILGDRAPQVALAEKVALGLFAFLGLALKPYFLLIPAAIVLAGPFRSLFKRTIDPANLALGCSLLAYAGFIMTAHPEYLTQIAPLATRVYSSFGFTPTGVLLRSEMLALACLVPIYFWKGAPADGVTLRLLGAAGGSLASYLVQFKGWNYQIIPTSFFLMLGGVWLLWAKSAIPRRDLLIGVLAAMVVFLTLGRQLERGPYQAGTSATFSNYVERPDEGILVLSSNVSAAFPFVNEVKGRWSSRFPTQWLIPGAMVGLKTADCRAQSDACATFERILADARTAIVEDMARHRPDLVFIDVRQEKSYFEGLPFDYLGFLHEDPAFAPLWMHYRLEGEVIGYQVWKLR